MNSMHLVGRPAADMGVNEANGWSKVSSSVPAVDRNARAAGLHQIIWDEVRESRVESVDVTQHDQQLVFISERKVADPA